MRCRDIIYGMLVFFILISSAYSQEVTQIIRGRVVDAESQLPLPFASVSITTEDLPIGTTTNEQGNFRLTNVPVGRHNIQISFLGYETKVIPEIMVTSGKEVVLNAEMRESVSKIDEVQIKAYVQKDKPLNTMATVSARTFSVEEAQRYAGGFDDPARLASSFAGVSSGYLEDNGIIVRGNAPKGLLWQLEGVEIPNPNHFAGMTTTGGGGVSALSSLMLANSDFYTGAFPAEYGNALSGVFDIKLRTGNSENREYALQAGAMGVDLSSEGPFVKDHQASYLFNYRYSTFALIKPVLPEETNIPYYQDLCFKVNLPAGKAGNFSIWAIGTADKISFVAERDTSLWKSIDDREDGHAKQRMGAVGINHKYNFGKQTYMNTTLATTGDYTYYKEDYFDYNLMVYPSLNIKNTNQKYSLSSAVNHKFSGRHSNRTGIILNTLYYNTTIQNAPEPLSDMILMADEQGTSYLIQAFSQSKFNLTDNLKINLGLHSQYFRLNQEITLEPRLGITCKVSRQQSVSLAYGNHARMEPQCLYFARVDEGDSVQLPNKKLKLSKAHHLVLAYDISLNEILRLKIEPYFQYLYDVPVTPDSSYSAINIESIWYFNQRLVSEGTGTNYGIDVTFERFLNKGYYYLFTASLFESKYIGGDNIERMSRYNTNYVFNVLFGKEWAMGKKKNNILGINGRLNILGGKRTTPVNEELSHENETIVEDYSRLYEDQKSMVYHMMASVQWRKNKAKYSSIWTLQIINLLGSKENYGYYYNTRTNEIHEEALTIIVPNISYKIEF